MQRRILAALAARPGGDRIRNTADYGFTLAAGIHDMRQMCKEVAQTHGGISHCSFVSESWSASFTRALTSLASQGYIEVPSRRWPQLWTLGSKSQFLRLARCQSPTTSLA
jgi:hypothetical protein